MEYPTMSQKKSDMEEEEQHCAHAMQLVTSAAVPFVLNAAIELHVFEILAKAGQNVRLSAQDIASQFTTKNPEAASMLDRMLCLLACNSLLTCSVVDNAEDGDDYGVQRFYGLAPAAKFFVKNEDGASMAPFCALLQDKVFIQSWFELKDSVLEGGLPFERAHGTYGFDYASKDCRYNEVFNKAMINHSTIAIGKILENYKGFNNLKTLVDVGGSLGINLKMIISKFPSIKGINFDLPHVVHNAPPYPGIVHVGGDMFTSVPQGDAIFMKWILNDWSDENCVKLLRNCMKSLPSDGKVIVVDHVYPIKLDSSESVKYTSEFDVLMMTQAPGGRVRTEKEFVALAKGAGFQGILFQCVVCNLSVMEFYK